MSVTVGGFVLAGGRSSRMGEEKALLELDGEALLARGLRLLGVVCAEVAIAGGSPDLARFGRLVSDETAGQGPLSGIIASLEDTAFEWNLFCPVDVPFVPRTAWQRLLEHAPLGGVDAILARVCGQVQPLCGLYRKQVGGALRAQLQGGQRKVTAAIEAVGPVVWVDFDQPREDQWFRNVNTPEDYEQMLHPNR